MTKNNKGRAPNQDATPKTTDSRNHTGTFTHPPAKARMAERGAAMKAQFKEMIVRLAVWGLIPAGFATWLIQRGGLKDA
jgi:hypothetical protein